MSKTELKKAFLQFKHTGYKTTRPDLMKAYSNIHFPKEFYANCSTETLIHNIHSSFDQAVRKLMKDGEVKRYVQLLNEPIPTPDTYRSKRQMRKVVMFELVNKQL